jgi:hypothetical protein
MRKRLFVGSIAAAGITAILIVSLSAGASAEPTEASVPAKPLTTAEIRSLAVGTAAEDGEMAPEAVEATSGTLAQSAQATDPEDAPPVITDPRTGRPWGDSAVDVVTMRGQFTANGPHPAGMPAPTGTVLTLTIDAKSGRVVAQSLRNTPTDLRQINPAVTTLGS